MADLDGDEELDLIFPGDSGASVLLGAGDGSFSLSSSTDAYHGGAGGTVADFDGDGRIDLAIGKYCFGCPVALALGNGDGTFQEPATLAIGHNSDSLAAGDFNEDGLVDLAFNEDGADVAGADGGSLSILLGAGFDSSSNQYAGASPRGLAVSDFNLDGHLDLVNGAMPLDGVRVSPGNGDGTLGSGITLAVKGYARYERLAVGDFNNDSKPDIALSVDTSDGYKIAVLVNTSH